MHQPNTIPPTPWTAPGFEAVKACFDQLLQAPDELGGAFCVYHNGIKVVDLWGGHASPARHGDWMHDTQVSTFSSCKAMVALCLLHLIDQGVADLDDTVAQHWPQFAREGIKAEITLRQLLNHSAGLPVTKCNRAGDVYDWDRMIAALEAAEPLWPAGSTTTYHAVTFGHLVGELVRRLSGLMPSAYFDRHFATPLGLQYSLHLKPEDKARTAVCDGYNWKVRLRCGLFTHVLPHLGGWKLQYFRPCGSDYHPSSPRWQNSEAPAISGFGTADALARAYAMLAGGGALQGTRVLSAEMVAQMRNQSPAPVDELGTGSKARIGLGMFFNLAPMADLGPNPNSFGHCGMGGSTGFVDPDRGLGVGYVCNHLYQPDGKSNSIIGDRASRLITVLYECLEHADQ